MRAWVNQCPLNRVVCQVQCGACEDLCFQRGADKEQMVSVENITRCGGVLRTLQARAEWRGKVQRQADYNMQRDGEVSI